MCLWVKESHVQNPIVEVQCIKVLCYDNGQWRTPYQGSKLVVGTGWFAPEYRARARTTEFRKDHSIYGGYIHAHTSMDNTACRVLREQMPKKLHADREYAFLAYARDVVAVGAGDDVVCKALYIPAFDLSGQNRNAVLDFSKKR